MRESVFSSLGETIVGKTVLDLFAGSGAYGLESLSRGARLATFVERSPRQAASLQANLIAVTQSLGQKQSSARTYTADVFKWEPSGVDSFDLIFADPPYAILPKQADLLFMQTHTWLSPHPTSRLVLEAPGEFDYVPSGWDLQRRLGKGSKRGEPTVLIYSPAL